ncbi:hypothetical protein [Fluviispira multicolorata]|uniref:Uncharacterized protein n=1 Tax=Fluviispira multicolorata TaxID=2654512 RepID=A0A833JG05_9BACT|nr:hypothetical protein [Fluviispira multicolorata]KAB8031932.1 hypothetical protein GCL57_04610 [Fluviispira multicolorata]
MFNKITFIVLILVFFQARAKSVEKIKQDIPIKEQITPEQKVTKLCNEYETNKNIKYQKEFIEKIKNEVLLDDKVRAQFAKDLVQKKIKGCESALREYVTNMLSLKDYEPQLGEQGFLSLALMAKIPEAYKVIETEIDKGFLSSWIDILKESDDKAYMQSLSNWAFKVGKAIREIDKASLVESSEYGKIKNENIELKNPDQIRIWTPILMNRYLIENVKRKNKLNEDELANLNIIYAASTPSYKEIFGDEIAKIAKNNIGAWIRSFRKEPVWAQFRLFQLMEKIGGGDIKREIIWISNYHESIKMRAIAVGTLDKLALKHR